MDSLIPIHIDIDEGDYFVRDTFLWDASQQSVDMDTFAEWYCEDQQPPLPLVPFREIVARSVSEQLRHRMRVAHMIDRHSLLQWYLQKRREQRRREREEERQSAMDDDVEPVQQQQQQEEEKEKQKKGGSGDADGDDDVDDEDRSDSLITVELDNVRYGDLVLKDKFQWDLRTLAAARSGGNGGAGTSIIITPEQFAMQVVKDTRLDPHFTPLIACHLREKLWNFWEQQLADYELEHCDPHEYQRVVQQRLQKTEQAKRQLIHQQQIAQQQQQLMQYHGTEGPLTNAIQRKYLFGRLFNPITRSVSKTSYQWSPRHGRSTWDAYQYHSIGDSSDDDDDDEDEDLDLNAHSAHEFMAASLQNIEMDQSTEEVMQKSGLVREERDRDSWYPTLMRISPEDAQRLEQIEVRERRVGQRRR